MQGEIERILEKLNSLLKGDGSRLALIEWSGSSITVQFEKGQSSDCESCAMDSDAIEMLVREAVANHLPSITQVKLING